MTLVVSPRVAEEPVVEQRRPGAHREQQVAGLAVLPMHRVQDGDEGREVEIHAEHGRWHGAADDAGIGIHVGVSHLDMRVDRVLSGVVTLARGALAV